MVIASCPETRFSPSRTEFPTGLAPFHLFPSLCALASFPLSIFSYSMVPALLQELQRDSRQSPETLAKLLNLSVAEVKTQIADWEKDGTILGYHAVIDPDRAGHTGVTALIEVKLSPEREGGFDRIAARVSKFNRVVSCFLMSGAYDLALFVEAPTLREVAQFVTEKLSTMDGVLSTSTHFQLKTYKQNGFLAGHHHEDERLSVSP